MPVGVQRAQVPANASVGRHSAATAL